MVPGLVWELRFCAGVRSYWACKWLLPCDSGRQLAHRCAVLPCGRSLQQLPGLRAQQLGLPACPLPRSAVKSAGRASVPERHGTGVRDEPIWNDVEVGCRGLGLKIRQSKSRAPGKNQEKKLILFRQNSSIAAQADF